MILIALGANLPTAKGSPPQETCEWALDRLKQSGVRILAVSRWFRTPPDPPSDQPDYVNGVARLESGLNPRALLTLLHEVERAAGRIRAERNEARPLDLDLIDHCGAVEGGGNGLVLPHPRAHRRLFVLRPLADVAPHWRHPVSRRSVAELIERLGDEFPVVPIGAEEG